MKMHEVTWGQDQAVYHSPSGLQLARIQANRRGGMTSTRACIPQKPAICVYRAGCQLDRVEPR